MPKNPIDYSKTIMYKLCCNDFNIPNIYVGHTTDFNNRKAKHKCELNRGSNQLVYRFIRDNGGFDNWVMLQIEEFKCENKREAEIRERYWFETLKADLNSRSPYESKEERESRLKIKNAEYSSNHREELREYSKQYYIDNKEIIHLKYDEAFTCLCGSIIQKGEKARHEKTKKHLNFINSSS